VSELASLQEFGPRVIICGSRKWHDREKISRRLAELVLEMAPNYPVIVHGAAKGADTIADQEAGKAGLLTDPHPADWKRHGKAAGPIRNREMAADGAVLCIGFGPTHGSGTEDMLIVAQAHGIPTEIIA